MSLTFAKLREKILALNSPDVPYAITFDNKTAQAKWNLMDTKWREKFAAAKMLQAYEIECTFDETQHTAIYTERTGTITWSAGVPSVSFSNPSFSESSPETNDDQDGELQPSRISRIFNQFTPDIIKRSLFQVIEDSGWKVRKKSIKIPYMLPIAIGIILLIAGGGFLAVRAVTKKTLQSPTASASQTPASSRPSSSSPDPKASLPPSNTSVSSILLSTKQKYDAQGVIEKAVTQDTFAPTDTVHGSVTVTLTQKAPQTLDISLRNEKTQDISPIATQNIPQLGTQVVHFRFQPRSKKGLPTGDYTVLAKLSSGDQAEEKFTIK